MSKSDSLDLSILNKREATFVRGVIRAASDAGYRSPEKMVTKLLDTRKVAAASG